MESGLRPPASKPAHSQPPELRPPGTVPDPSAVSSGLRGSLWLALIAVAVLGLGVLYVLPQWVTERDAATTGPATGAPPPPAIDPAADRRQAEQALQAYLQLRARLELANAAAWGESDWSEAAAEAGTGDRLFGQRRFAAAARTYGAARERLARLEDTRDERLASALEAGRRALAANDGEAARRQFGLVLAMEPDHSEARRALERARVRSAVLDHLGQGRDAEAQGRLEEAQAAFREAVLLDGDYRPAREGLKRVERQLAEDGFRVAMSRALAALDDGRLTEAGAALDVAARLQPGDASIADARLRLQQAARRAQLAGLQRRAAAAAREEDWTAAEALCRKALAVDSRAGFAREGLALAKDRATLHRQLDHYLDDPARLYSPEPLANAATLLAAVGQAPAGESRLAEKIGRLEDLVAGARTPLPVTLHSDGETEVTIYHVGRLGQFHIRQLELRPGTYTVTGSRPGYRDVRKSLTIRPGAAPPPLEIRCEEPV